MKRISMSAAALIVAGCALGLSILAVTIRIDDKPSGKGMGAYAFDTPLGAHQSMLEIQLNNDILASREYAGAILDRKIREELETLEVKKTREAKGATLLFVEYKEAGLPKRKILTMEKDAHCGLWSETYVSSFGLRDTNEALAAEMEEWEK